MRHTVLKNIPALIMGGAIMISASLWSAETSALPIVTVVEDCGSCLELWPNLVFEDLS